MLAAIERSVTTDILFMTLVYSVLKYSTVSTVQRWTGETRTPKIGRAHV